MSSRMSIAPQRSLTLTEELERLEQSITLTLQEIDHNFSRAHRIVTSSIIPIVEQYAKNSDQVWEGSKFWKQFFEASANISLSSYEEGEQDETFVTQSTEAQDQHHAGQHDNDDGADETITTDEDHNPPTSTQVMDDSLADSLLSSPSVRSNRTPLASGKSSRPSDDTQRSILSANDGSDVQLDDPTTPGRRDNRARSMTETPGRPSPFLHSAQPTTQRKQQNDVLLHRVLDKTYRVQATPHSTRKTTGRPQGGQKEDNSTKTQQSRSFALDSSPLSPDMAAPQLRAEIFGSPARPRAGAGGAPPTPGVSVQQGKAKTPRRGAAGGAMSARKTLFSKDIAANASGARGKPRDDPTQTQSWGLDDDDDEIVYDDDGTSGFDYELGMSPPKTLQFHVPQSRLQATPAREASRRIVAGLMADARVGQGADGDEDEITDTMSSPHVDTTRYRDFEDDFTEDDKLAARGGGGANDDDSPSVVRVARDPVDDSF